METYSKIDISFDSGADEDFYCESLNDDSSGLAIMLRGSKSLSMLRINFNFFYSYKKTNESYRLQTISQLPDDRYIILNVKSSSFLDWLHRESQGIYSEHNIYHFMIITGDDIIDVLSNRIPQVVYFANGNGVGQNLNVKAQGSDK